MELLIISCGVAGAELGALLGANKVGLETGGWALKDSVSEYYTDLMRVHKTKHEDYWTCAQKCIHAADGTCIVGSLGTPEIQRIQKECVILEQPTLRIRYRIICDRINLVMMSRLLTTWIRNNEIKTLFITGDKEGKNFGVQGYTEALMVTAHQELRRPGALKDFVEEPRNHRRRRRRT